MDWWTCELESSLLPHLTSSAKNQGFNGHGVHSNQRNKNKVKRTVHRWRDLLSYLRHPLLLLPIISSVPSVHSLLSTMSDNKLIRGTCSMCNWPIKVSLRSVAEVWWNQPFINWRLVAKKNFLTMANSWQTMTKPSPRMVSGWSVF